MDIAHIWPTQLLRQYARRQNTHLILVHVCDESPEYAAYYAEAVKRGDHVILDNSAYEKGGADDETLLMEWAEIIQPTELVLPDVLFDANATFVRSMEMLKILNGEQAPDWMGCVMAVPQGRTAEEWMESYEAFRTHPDIDAIGIFLKAEELFEGGRLELLTRLKQLKRHNTVPIHLLGTDAALNEVRKVPLDHPWVRSTDSTKFVSYALGGVEVWPHQGACGPYPKRRDNFFHAPVEWSVELHRILEINLETANRWSR